jgi:hypothetical protein
MSELSSPPITLAVLAPHNPTKTKPNPPKNPKKHIKIPTKKSNKKWDPVFDALISKLKTV